MGFRKDMDVLLQRYQVFSNLAASFPYLLAIGIDSTRVDLEQDQSVAVNMVHREDANTRNYTLHYQRGQWLNPQYFIVHRRRQWSKAAVPFIANGRLHRSVGLLIY